MHRRRILAAGMVGIAGLAGCSSLGDDAGRTTTSPSGNDTATVDMVFDESTNYFDPIGLAIDPGDAVSFVMQSGNHSATAYHEENALAETTRIPDEAAPFDSGVLTDEGETYEHTFDVAGTYDYYCTPHKMMGMVGRIVVGDPGGPAETGAIPDGSVPSSDEITKQGSVAYDEFS